MAQQQQAPMLQHTTDQFSDCHVDGTTAAAGAVSTSPGKDVTIISNIQQ